MRLIVITGPTATGKTALAVGLAHRLGAEILSADSRQVYRGLDLGTGKDLAEYRRFDPPVPYHLIDIADPRDTYSLFQYQRDCYAALERLEAAGHSVAILAGGTGMYLEAVLRGYRIANVRENPALRDALASRAREDLETELRACDPELAARTDLSSRKRIIRGLEIHAASKIQAVEFSRPLGVNLDFRVFATRWERAALRARIDARLDERLQEGMVAEVEGLLVAGIPRGRLDALGMEYREIAAFLAGEKTREGMVADLRHEIHMLAKRQETWFRGMDGRGVPVTWLEARQGSDEVIRQWEIKGGQR